MIDCMLQVAMLSTTMYRICFIMLSVSAIACLVENVLTPIKRIIGGTKFLKENSWILEPTVAQ